MSSVIPGRELLSFIEQLGVLEWGKCQLRFPTIKIQGKEPWTEDRSAFPPYASFRFRNEKYEIIQKLKAGVGSYKCSVDWMMDGHVRTGYEKTTNWIILPVELDSVREAASSAGLTAGQYMARCSPEFGPRAYDDLPGLVEHLRKHFQDSSTI